MARPAGGRPPSGCRAPWPPALAQRRCIAGLRGSGACQQGWQRWMQGFRWGNSWRDRRCLMSNRLNVRLTDQLRRYVEERASDKDVYATPSECIIHQRAGLMIRPHWRIYTRTRSRPRVCSMPLTTRDGICLAYQASRVQLGLPTVGRVINTCGAGLYCASSGRRERYPTLDPAIRRIEPRAPCPGS